MKKILCLGIVSILVISVYGQKTEPFNIKGDAKLVATWNSKKPESALGTLTNGDKIKIGTHLQIFVSVIHNNVEKQLISAVAEEKGGDMTVIKVYEYDFDNDGTKEIMVAYSSFFSSTHVEVFRYSGGLAELIGRFSGQIDIILDKNIISLPFGSQGLANDYICRKGAFYELVYLDPNKKQRK